MILRISTYTQDSDAFVIVRALNHHPYKLNQTLRGWEWSTRIARYVRFAP